MLFTYDVKRGTLGMLGPLGSYLCTNPNDPILIDIYVGF